MKKRTRRRRRHLAARSRYQQKKQKRNRVFRIERARNLSHQQPIAARQAAQREEILAERERKQPAQLVRKSEHSEFTMLNDAANVIEFVQGLKKLARRAFKKRKLLIDLSNVESIDIGAICILLSAVKELSYYRIEVSATLPEDDMTKKFIVDSGFMVHMSRITNKIQSETKTKNLILLRGKDKTRNKEVGEVIKVAIEMLTGIKEHYPPIFSLVQEINGNSIEHAYGASKKEHWLLAINHDKISNKVVFTFADNGFGILNTLHRKISQQIFEGLQLFTEGAILRGAFTKKYSSRHEYQINRNKGLPLLKKIQTHNAEVKNLFVITNQVFLYIDSYETVPIAHNFSGTFYYWELDQECIVRWRAKAKQ